VNHVNQLIEWDLNRLAQKLAENPARVPGKKRSEVDPTSEMLPMSSTPKERNEDGPG
jgi:hypothetical protein